MEKDISIHLVDKGAHLDAVKDLLRDYAGMRDYDLALGDFEAELEKLPGEYQKPAGALLLANVEGNAAGCVAFRYNMPEYCEMKRMYVSDAYRKLGIGQKLVTEICQQAREAGYTYMRLDTHPWMASAMRLYRKMGFTEIGRYNQNPIPGIRFFEKKL
ncbi:MAG: GNAT family N-acetyltransferase [Bacteroidota bacterium]